MAAKAEVAEALRREAAAVEAAAKWEATALEALAKADEAMAAAAAQQQQQQQATVGTHKWEDDASAMAVAEKMREERDRAREDAVIARLTASRANAKAAAAGLIGALNRARQQEMEAKVQLEVAKRAEAKAIEDAARWEGGVLDGAIGCGECKGGGGEGQGGGGADCQAGGGEGDAGCIESVTE